MATRFAVQVLVLFSALGRLPCDAAAESYVVGIRKHNSSFMRHFGRIGRRQKTKKPKHLQVQVDIDLHIKKHAPHSGNLALSPAATSPSATVPITISANVPDQNAMSVHAAPVQAWASQYVKDATPCSTGTLQEPLLCRHTCAQVFAYYGAEACTKTYDEGCSRAPARFVENGGTCTGASSLAEICPQECRAALLMKHLQTMREPARNYTAAAARDAAAGQVLSAPQQQRLQQQQEQLQQQLQQLQQMQQQLQRQFQQQLVSQQRRDWEGSGSNSSAQREQPPAEYLRQQKRTQEVQQQRQDEQLQQKRVQEFVAQLFSQQLQGQMQENAEDGADGQADGQADDQADGSSSCTGTMREPLLCKHTCAEVISFYHTREEACGKKYSVGCKGPAPYQAYGGTCTEEALVADICPDECCQNETSPVTATATSPAFSPAGAWKGPEKFAQAIYQNQCIGFTQEPILCGHTCKEVFTMVEDYLMKMTKALTPGCRRGLICEKTYSLGCTGKAPFQDNGGECDEQSTLADICPEMCSHGAS